MPSSRAEALPLIELRSIGKSYVEGDTEHVILREVHGSIEAGEFVALLGRSGSGKSTLLNLISGIDSPSAGEVLIDGVAIQALSEYQRTLFRRHNIGFVFQFFNLIPTLTVEENLLLPIELQGRRLVDLDQTPAQLLTEVGLSERMYSFPDRLSGGEQQRVAIARALVAEPKLLLADEPTGNLDSDTGHGVLDLLERLVRRRGKTMVMATHSREIARRADRVLAIREHRLRELCRGSLS